jgi:hypothetical protein
MSGDLFLIEACWLKDAEWHCANESIARRGVVVDHSRSVLSAKPSGSLRFVLLERFIGYLLVVA